MKLQLAVSGPRHDNPRRPPVSSALRRRQVSNRLDVDATVYQFIAER